MLWLCLSQAGPLLCSGNILNTVHQHTCEVFYIDRRPLQEGLSETQPFCVACRHASCFARPLCNARFARLIACCCSLCSPPRLLITVHISLARQPTPGLLASLASFAASPVVCFTQLARCARLLSLTSFASSPRLLLVHLAARSARLGPGSSLRSPGSSLRSRLLFASLARLLLACLLLAWQLT